jgi:ADP-ribosyltransferase exoenzyme
MSEMNDSGGGGSAGEKTATEPGESEPVVQEPDVNDRGSPQLEAYMAQMRKLQAGTEAAKSGGSDGAGADQAPARTFASNAEGAAYGKETWQRAQQELSDEQRTALHGYSTEKYPGEVAQPDYKEINGCLRGFAPLTAEVAKSIEQIDQALSIQRVPENLTVLREVGPDAFDRPVEHLANTVQRDPAYLSAALGSDPTFDPAGTKIVVHLEVPAGTPGMYMGGVAEYSERELLLGRGLSYQVDKVESVNGRWHVYGRVLSRPSG